MFSVGEAGVSTPFPWCSQCHSLSEWGTRGEALKWCSLEPVLWQRRGTLITAHLLSTWGHLPVSVHPLADSQT